MRLASLIWPFNRAKNFPRADPDRFASSMFSGGVGICLLLAAIPIVTSAINSNWLYTPIGFLDPWVNVGYFLHYSDPTFGGGYYKIARLSWLVPGFIAYHLFQPIVANYLLHMGCLLLIVIFFFLTVARLFGPVIAFATAACFALYVPFHSANAGWDYQDAPAAAYYVITFYLLTVATLSGRLGVFLLWPGVAYAAAIHANISFINMAPILVLHCVTLYHHRFGVAPSWRLVLRGGLWFIAGAIIVTVLLGMINVAVGREFLFFQPLLDIVISRVKDSGGQAEWWRPWSSKWFWEIGPLRSLALSFATLICCVVSIAVATLRGRANLVAVSLQVQFLFIGLLWVFWQSVGQVALEPDYFVYPIYPVMFFAMAGMAATWRWAESPQPGASMFYVFVAVIVVIPLSFPSVSIGFRQLAGNHVQLIMITSALVVAALFAVTRGRQAVVATAVLAFAITNGFAAANGAWDLYAFRPKCADSEGAYAALIETNLFLNRFVPNPAKMFVWWKNSEQLTGDRGCSMTISYFAGSMASLGLFPYLAPPWNGMPEADALPATSNAVIAGGGEIAIPTADYANVVAIIARFQQAGLPLAVQGRTIVRTSRFTFDLYVLGLSR